MLTPYATYAVTTFALRGSKISSSLLTPLLHRLVPHLIFRTPSLLRSLLCQEFAFWLRTARSRSIVGGSGDLFTAVIYLTQLSGLLPPSLCFCLCLISLFESTFHTSGRRELTFVLFSCHFYGPNAGKLDI